MTTCAYCGSPNLGTKFCESCGAVVQTAASAVPAPIAPVYTPTLNAPQHASVGATPLRVVALVFLLLGNAIPGLLNYLIYSSGAILPELSRVSAISFISLTGLFMLIAAIAGKAGGGGKALGALFAIAYSALVIWLYFGGFVDGSGYVNAALFVLSHCLLFFSWALGRPFRGPGYFGLLLLAAVGIGGALIDFIPNIFNNYLGYIGLNVGVAWGSVWLVVGLSVLFEGKPDAGASRMPAPLPVASTNRLARLSLIFSLSVIGLQILATLLVLAGLYFVSIFVSPLGLILVILAIVLGHIGRHQIRRTGQRGAGQALAGLIISYVLIALGVGSFVVQLVVAASISSNYYGE